jgi:hypothetical protein
MKNAPAALLALALVPAFAVIAAPRDATACGSAIRLEVKPQAKPTPVQEIARAEKALESGQALVATQAVIAAFPKVRAATAGADALETRALRVFALALVRSDGAADERKAGIPGATEWTKSANLDWAVQALREIDQKRPNDPALRADLGEALAKVARGEGEAMTILGGLEKKDLMGSPHAYAALARLREKKGDLAGAEAAVKRCEEMTKAWGVCRPALPSAPKAKPAEKA